MATAKDLINAYNADPAIDVADAAAVAAAQAAQNKDLAKQAADTAALASLIVTVGAFIDPSDDGLSATLYVPSTDGLTFAATTYPTAANVIVPDAPSTPAVVSSPHPPVGAPIDVHKIAPLVKRKPKDATPADIADDTIDGPITETPPYDFNDPIDPRNV